MIDLENISFGYPNSLLIFKNFSWHVKKGEAWAVLGPSGCGKSTLLYLLAGLRFPTSGNLSINKTSLTRPRPHTGLILQDYGLLPWVSVYQNAELGIRIRNFYGPDGKHAPEIFKPQKSIEDWLIRLGLSGLTQKYPGQLSGGQRQRTAIARTLVLEPDILLMDEPFCSLDAPTREDLQKLTLELWAEQELTMLIVTHTIEEAAILGRKILLLRQPPHSETVIIENPSSSRDDFRHSIDYFQLIRELRQKMEMLN